MKTFKIVGNDMSDGYHTFDELYEHRCLLFINLILAYGQGAYKPDHYEGWDCLYFDTTHGQISYHVPSRLRYLYDGHLKCDPDYVYDGHTSSHVIARLTKMAVLGRS